MQEIDSRLQEMKEKIDKEDKLPILFVGSGISRRYYDTPDWRSLLKMVASKVEIDEEIENWGTNENIATELEYHCFSKYKPDYTQNEDRRYPFRKIIKEIIEQKKDVIDEKKEELSCLANITPTAIVTTNYDELLENVFRENDFSVCVGQDIILSNNNPGTIYKIHGSILNPASIVITQEDYDKFMENSKYLYAKLMTLFWEYPIVFMGYSINDENVKNVLDTMLDVMSEEQKEKFEQRVWILAFTDKEEFFKEEERSVGKNRCKIKTFYLDKSYQKFYETLSEATDGILEKDLKFEISENAIDLLIEPLYQKQDKIKVVVRELLQNAIDACKKFCAQIQVTVTVSVNDNSVNLKVFDCGIGMNWTDIKEYFLTIGKSSKDIKDEVNYGLTGKFGIGILSIFLISSEAYVYSKKRFSTSVGLHIFQDSNEKKVEKITVNEKELIYQNGTTIKLVIRDKQIVNSIKGASKIDNVLHVLGLNNYYVWENSQIEIVFNEEKKKIEKFNYEFTEKINDYLYIQKMYCKDNENQKYVKKTALINDMIVKVTFAKGTNTMIKDNDIPFFAIRTRCELYGGNVRPNLERSEVEIIGNLRDDIIKYVYKEEIAKLIGGLKEKIGKQANLSVDELRNIVSECKLLKKQDIIYTETAIVIPSIGIDVVKIYNSLDVFKECIKYKRCSYKLREIKKADLGDMIEMGYVKGIGGYYLEKNIFNATGSYNGFRMQVIKILFEKIGISTVPYDNAMNMWSVIIENKNEFKQFWEKQMTNGILWLDEEYKPDMSLNEINGRVIISREWVNAIDAQFREMLRNELNKEENNDVSKYIMIN